MTGINTLEYGAGCTVTTRHIGIVSGDFLGIEVAHGDHALLVAGHGATRSIPFDLVISASGPIAAAA